MDITFGYYSFNNSNKKLNYSQTYMRLLAFLFVSIIEKQEGNMRIFRKMNHKSFIVFGIVDIILSLAIAFFAILVLIITFS